MKPVPHQLLMIAFLSLAAQSSSAAVISFSGSVTAPALIYDPATDYSPGTGYNPPGSLGGYDGLITLQGFDTTLGTLNSVTLTTAGQASLEFTQAYSFNASSNTINAVLYMSGQTPYGAAGFNLFYTFTSS